MPEVNIDFKTTFDGKGADQAAVSVKKVAAAAKETDVATKTTAKSLGGLGSQANGAKQVAENFNAIGKEAKGLIGQIPFIGKALLALSIPAAVMSSVNAYISQVGSSTQLGNDWLVATDKLDKAWYNVGKTLAAVILPVLQKLAELAERAAAAFAAMPQFNFGTQTTSWVDPTPVLSDEQRREQMRATGIATSGAGVGGTSLALTKEIYQLNRQEIEQQTRFDHQMQVMGDAHRLQEEYAEADHQKALMRSQRDYNRQEQYANEDFQRSVYRANRDFQIQEKITIEAYNRQRMIATRDFNISQARAEYDYNKQRSRAQEDHNWSIRMAMLQGDAMAVWQANRQFNIDKKRGEEDYQLSKTRAAEDFARSQSDNAIAFAIERKNNREQFARSQADALLDFTIQRKRAKVQFDIMRADQEKDYQIQRDRANAAFVLQENLIRYQFSEEQRLRRQQFIDKILFELMKESDIQLLVQQRLGTAILNYWQGLIDRTRGGNFTAPATVYGSVAGPGAARGYDAGGYIDRTGMAFVHSGEYVLTANTTKAAQAMAGGRMSQNGILDMLGNRISMVNNFSRGMSADEKYILKSQMMQLMAEGFN